MTEVSMEDEQIKHIARIYNLFEMNTDGKKFLDEIKTMLGSCAPFPMVAAGLEQYGNSVEVYAGFKSGQLNLIKYIESAITQYQNIISTKTNEEKSYAE